MSNFIQFGEDVKGYPIRVLNEREIRASAGILFLIVYTSFMIILFKGDFIPLKYSLVLFLSDFIIRIFVNPKFSPLLILGRLIVRNQTPEYVGAAQKKFSWIIGLSLSVLMFIFFIFINAYSVITGITCLICLIFLFFESAFGICLGCKMYSWFYKEKVQYCPGEVCDVKSKHDIQKTSKFQLLVVLGFAVYIFIIGLLFHDSFKVQPHDLFGSKSTDEVR